MGHACEVLTFETDNKKKIQQVCDTWGDHNADLEERGWTMGRGLGCPVQFTNKVFDDEEDATDYLEGTFGQYRQTAVRFKRYPEQSPTKAMEDLRRRIGEYRKRVTDIDNHPHYAGVESKVIRCKKCGSSLATEYCGKSWYNACPICRNDLRPASMLDKRAKYTQTIKDLEKKLREEEKKQQKKIESKAKICWAVAVEVHC